MRRGWVYNAMHTQCTCSACGSERLSTSSSSSGAKTLPSYTLSTSLRLTPGETRICNVVSMAIVSVARGDEDLHRARLVLLTGLT